MGRVAGKPKVAAFQQKRRRPACEDAQSGQRLFVQSLESINLLQAKFQHSS